MFAYPNVMMYMNGKILCHASSNNTCRSYYNPIAGVWRLSFQEEYWTPLASLIRRLGERHLKHPRVVVSIQVRQIGNGISLPPLLNHLESAMPPLTRRVPLYDYRKCHSIRIKYSEPINDQNETRSKGKCTPERGRSRGSITIDITIYHDPRHQVLARLPSCVHMH